MKKWMALLFAGIMVAGIAGCGDKPADAGAEGEKPPVDAPAPAGTDDTKKPDEAAAPATDAAPTDAAPAPGGEAPKTDGAAAPPAGETK